LFDIAYDDEGASLLINSNEQMFSEKLRSLLRFGTFSTRFKDVYDMYYLKDHVQMERLYNALDTYIFSDAKMRETQGKDIVRRLDITFRDKEYIRALEQSDKRWIDKDVKTVITELMKFVKKIER
jgi:predicted nucleotidyltransferase component of viral defense system